MADLKTKPTDQSVQAFLDSLENEQQKKDAYILLELMKAVTGEEPVLWGSSMIGFGSYHYKYASGREGDTFVTGFSPRKQNLTLYIMAGFDQYQDLMDKLGKHTTGKSCLYVKKLADVDQETLKTLVRLSAEHIKESHQ